MLRGLLIVLLVVALPGARAPAAAHPGPAAQPGATAALAIAETGFSFPLPAPVTVLTAFDPPDRPWGSGHRGVDLAGAVGAQIRASAAGAVIYAGNLAGRGVVSVQHANGLRTTYEPVDAEVSAGEHVAPGQVLGRLAAGHPACAPAVCLHWGARTGPDAYLDPMLLVTGRRVRLLTWDGLPPCWLVGRTP
jgi:murein DD-endopeptidase MepM/ murein hydrolase activator NlpD